jgi:hypothetical protein
MRWRGKTLVLLMLPALFAATPAPPQAVPPAIQPRHKVGDSFDVADTFLGIKCKHWQVTDLDFGGYLIFRCQDKLAYFAAGHGFALRQIVTEKGEVLAAYQPYLPPLPWPLTLGKKWSGDYDGYTLNGGHSWHARSSCEVKAIEPLPIGGRQVWTYRYDCADDWRSGLFWGTAYSSGWYSPDAKMVVKATLSNNPRADWQIVDFKTH